MSQLLRIVLAYNQIPLAPKAYHWFCSFPLLSYMCTEQTHAYKARGHANISQNYKWKPLSDILLYSCYWGSQNFLHILGLDASCDVITTRIQSKVVSQFEKWNEQPCYKSNNLQFVQFTRATLDKRTESGTNPCYSFGLCGTEHLSAWASRNTIIELLQSRDPFCLHHHAVRQEKSGANMKWMAPA